jgi:hypothetical protein
MLTPLSQRVAVERYEKRQKDKGLIQVNLWCPAEMAHELREKARQLRLEAELEYKKGGDYE